MSGILNTVANFLQPQFTTVPVVNLNYSTYSLSIRSPGIAGAPYLTYSFPLSPQNIRRESALMASVYDVAGPPNTGGVTRLVDQYGFAQPILTIEGTTGWQRHNMDMFRYTGLQSVQQLEKVIKTYIQFNQRIIATGGTDLYTLEFWDDFRGEYYQVEPIGELGMKQSAAQPLLVYYSLRLAAVKRLDMPIFNVLARALFSQAASVVMRSTLSLIGPVLSRY